MLKETLFTMSRQEIERLKVIEKVISGPMTQRTAAEMLGLGLRQVKRLCKAYLHHGERGLISKKRGKAGNRRYTQAFKDEVIGVVKAQYRDFGPTFAAEKLFERQNIIISHETLRCWMIEAGIWQPKRAHKAHKPGDNHPWRRYTEPYQPKLATQKGTFLTCGEGDISILLKAIISLRLQPRYKSLTVFFNTSNIAY